MNGQPVFAADRTFRRLREAGILAELRSTGSVTVEVICGNWHVRVRGCAGVGNGPRQWLTVPVDWDAVQMSAENPLTEAVERVAGQLGSQEQAATG